MPSERCPLPGRLAGPGRDGEVAPLLPLALLFLQKVTRPVKQTLLLRATETAPKAPRSTARAPTGPGVSGTLLTAPAATRWPLALTFKPSPRCTALARTSRRQVRRALHSPFEPCRDGAAFPQGLRRALFPLTSQVVPWVSSARVTSRPPRLSLGPGTLLAPCSPTRPWAPEDTDYALSHWAPALAVDPGAQKGQRKCRGGCPGTAMNRGVLPLSLPSSLPSLLPLPPSLPPSLLPSHLAPCFPPSFSPPFPSLLPSLQGRMQFLSVSCTPWPLHCPPLCPQPLQSVQVGVPSHLWQGQTQTQPSSTGHRSGIMPSLKDTALPRAPSPELSVLLPLGHEPPGT